MEIAKKRYHYLKEHYETVVIIGGVDRYDDSTSTKDIDKLMRIVKKYRKIKKSRDAYVSANIKIKEIVDDYNNFCRNALCKSIDKITTLYNQMSIEISKCINECLVDLKINLKLPKLIREIRREKNVIKHVINPDLIKIKHTRMPKRFKTMNQVVPDFSKNTTREQETMKVSTENMTPNEIIKDVHDKLLNISIGRETTSHEISKLAYMLQEAIDKMNKEDK